jgi:hypothetical protein
MVLGLRNGKAKVDICLTTFQAEAITRKTLWV